MEMQEGSQEPVETTPVEGQIDAAPAVEETPPVDLRSPLQKHLDAAEAKLTKDPEPKEPPKAAGEVTPVAGEVPPPPAYTPNFKLKVMDQEHEIPEKFRAMIKDAESEKEVREIFEKAFGLDHVKPKLQVERQAREQYEQAYGQLSGQVQDLQKDYQRGDYDSFFKKLEIPFENLLQYVAQEIEYRKLPPDQRQIVDGRRQAEQRSYALEREQSTQTQQSQQMLTESVQHALDLTLARADVKTAAESYDSRVGKPGAFKSEVQKRGHFYWVTQGKLIPPGQAVEEVLGLVGGAPAPAGTPAAATPAAATPPVQAANTATAPKAPPVIPNVQGKSTSPLPKKPRSIAELKELAAQM